MWEMDLAQIEKLDAGVSFHQKFRESTFLRFLKPLNFVKEDWT
ncbi:hypothetical protein [Blautia argi]|nr:hypothetical protein [Blautia argi]